MATALETLLSRIAAERGGPLPEPANSVPLGPLSTDTSAAFAARNPEPTPPRFTSPAPVDMAAVNQSVGPAPVRPTLPNPGLLERILTTIGGVGAGIQGNAAPYIEQVRRQRNAPIEQFERDQAVYNQRRDRAFEIAERRAERQAEMENRALEAAYERDYRVWLSKNSNRDDAGKEAMRQAFIRERDIRAERLEVERELKREQRAREVEARQITERYFTATKNRPLSAELGRYYSGLSDKLSPAAAKLDAAVQGVGQARMNRAVNTGGGRVGVSNAAMRALGAFNGALGEVRGAVSRGDVRGERTARRKLDTMYGRLSAFPGQIERGIGAGWPWAKLAGQSAPAPAGAQPQAQGPSPARAQAKAKLMSAGFQDAEAEAELNRLGIQ